MSHFISWRLNVTAPKHQKTPKFKKGRKQILLVSGPTFEKAREFVE